MKTPIQRLLASAALLLLGVSCALAQTVNFNGAAFDLNASFRQTNTNNWAFWLGAAGINDQAASAAGGAAATNNASPNLQYIPAITTAGKEAFTVSALVRGDFANTGVGATALSLGFNEFTWTNFTSANSYVALKLVGTAANTFEWNTSVWGGNFPQGQSVTLNSTNWYLIAVTFTKSSTAGTWNWLARVSDYGPTGLVLLATGSSASGTLAHTSTFNAANLYAAISFTAGATNTYVDNFTVAAGAATPAAPSNLAATPGDAQITLAWTASAGATSYTIKRSTTAGTGYATASSGTVTGTSFTDTGLTNGTPYYYLVSAVSAAESAHSSEASATPVAPAPGSKIVRIDFGPGDTTNGNPTSSPDSNGRYWNNLVSGNVVASNLALSNLVTTTNAATSFGLSVSSTGWRSNGILNGGLLAPSASLLGELAIPAATQDYFYLEGAGTSATLTLTGLDQTKRYNLRFFGTRDTAEIRRSTYTVTGANGAFAATLQTSGTGIGGNGTSNGNDSQIASVNDVQPDALSQLQIQLSVTTSAYAYLGLMEITEVPGPVVVSRTVRVDFGPGDTTNGNPTTSPDSNGRYWNNLVSGNVVANGLAISNLVTTSNSTTTLGLSVSSTGWRSNGILNGGLLAPNATLLGELAIATATQDYFYLDGAGATGTLTITGLNPAKYYDLRLFGTRDNTETRRSTYTVTGGNGVFATTLQTSGNNIGSNGTYDGNDNKIAVINGVQPDGSAQLQLQLSVAASTFAYLGLLEITETDTPTPAPPPVAITDGVDRWVAQDALDPIAPGSVLFVGSSSVRRWESLTRDFADYRITQRGFGGSQFSDINLLLNKIVTPFQPSAIVVWAGTNDIRVGGKSAATVLADFQTFVTNVQAQVPGVPICYLAITPCPSFFTTPGQDQTRRDANTLIAAYCAANPALNLRFIDTSTFFENLHDAGTPAATDAWNSYFVDDTHLNRAGYAVWLSIVRPALATVLAPNKIYTANPSTLAPGEKLFFDFGPSDATTGDETNQTDANGNKWNNWHPTNGGGTINSGEHLKNLVRSTGTGTGIRMAVTGGFLGSGKTTGGGLLAPSPALLGDLAVETATADYWYSTADDILNGPSDDVPGGFMLDGLDPALSYTFQFLGSRSTTETRVTEFKVYGANQASANLQTSGTGIGSTGANANDSAVVTLSGIRPDVFGQVFIDLTLLQGAQTHLNAMKLTAAAVLTPFQIWRSTHFTAPELANSALETSLWGDTADPDADGRANLLEYATGTAPRTADPGSAATLGQSVANKLTLSFTRIADPALTYTVRGSSDLTATWTETPVFTTTGAANTAGSVTAEDTVTTGSQPRRFLRLEVTR